MVITEKWARYYERRLFSQRLKPIIPGANVTDKCRLKLQVTLRRVSKFGLFLLMSF